MDLLSQCCVCRPATWMCTYVSRAIVSALRSLWPSSSNWIAPAAALCHVKVAISFVRQHCRPGCGSRGIPWQSAAHPFWNKAWISWKGDSYKPQPVLTDKNLRVMRCSSRRSIPAAVNHCRTMDMRDDRFGMTHWNCEDKTDQKSVDITAPELIARAVKSARKCTVVEPFLIRTRS